MEELRHLTGMDSPVREYVFGFQQTKDYLKRLEELLTFSLPLYAEEGKTNLVIAVGCTGGHHRSVAFVQALQDHLRRQGRRVTVTHRDIEK
jgi:UPF0042 nucleotide-binding protein